jgi:hypothetical protein
MKVTEDIQIKIKSATKFEIELTLEERKKISLETPQLLSWYLIEFEIEGEEAFFKLPIDWSDKTFKERRL